MMLKKIIAVLMAVPLVLTGCATQVDKEMYSDYTNSIASVSHDTLEMYSSKLSMLANSLEQATTPLERHLVREAILKLDFKIQTIARATNGNDIALKLAGESSELLKTAGMTLVGYEGVKTIGKIVDSAGSVTASGGSSIRIEKPESHNTIVGNNNVPTNKADPIVVEVPQAAVPTEK